MKEKKEKLSFEDKLKELSKKYGKIETLGEKKIEKLQVYSSQSVGLDLALGVGGYPKGRIVEIFGQESSGKTTTALHAVAECQANGGRACFVDAEHAYDKLYAESIGVDSDKLYLYQPSSGEDGLNFVEDMLDTDEFDMIIVDSVAALTPQAEIEGEMGDNRIGLHARLMSQAMRKLVAKVHKSDCVLIFINQMREKIGVMFGDPNVTTGGNALKFYASIRLEVSRSVTNANSVIEGDIKIGNLTKVRVKKNKVAPPFRECEFNILYGIGIDKFEELLAIAVDREIITKAGAYYSYGETKLGSKDEVINILKDNAELFDEVKEKIKNG